MKHLLFFVTFLILVTKVYCQKTESFYLPDTIYFESKNSTPLGINIRTIEFKNGIINVQKFENETVYGYNYLDHDIAYIITNDSNYVKRLYKNKNEYISLFTYKRNNKILYYEDLYNKNDKIDESSKKTKTDSLKVLRQNLKKREKAKNDSINKITNSIDSSNFYQKIGKLKLGIQVSNYFIFSQNSNTSYNGFVTSEQSSKSFKIIGLGIGITLKDKWFNLHSLEIIDLQSLNYYNKVTNNSNGIARPIEGKKTQDFNILFGYQCNYYFNKNKNSKYYWGIVVSNNLSYSYSWFEPVVPNTFPRQIHSFIWYPSIGPTFTYFVNSNLFFSFKYPVNFVYLSYASQYVQNPNIPENQRTLDRQFSNFDYPWNNLQLLFLLTYMVNCK
ncbi:MAG: hypothetical protein SFY32_00330 [Bacteroidota bacterium]|nr:hypothetical protein [Bacteroidota bacterium]